MKILVIGGGGREHALCWKILQSSHVKELYCAPGNAGIAEIAQCIDIAPTDIQNLANFAESNSVDLTIVGMENPLILGITDEFSRRNLKIFGPSKAAAEFEGSKTFAKNFMKKYNIPTAAYQIFYNHEQSKAIKYIETAKYPLVCKADGLCAGKGVIICQDFESAKTALDDFFKERKFGDAGNSIVIEEFLQGKEVSILAFCDGETVIPMASSTDYKRALDNDEGQNTGGMGAVSPSPYYNDDLAKKCMKEIFLPTIQGMKEEGREFIGCLYFGLMITSDGTSAKVIEYNCRFGDPETQVVLPRLDSDLVEIIVAACSKNLESFSIGGINEVKWKNESALCIIGVPMGYPEKYAVGDKINGLRLTHNNIDTLIFHAGTKSSPESDSSDTFLTSGGRSFALCNLNKDLNTARMHAYAAMEKIDAPGIFFRRDIGRF
ncbi:MAG: phosphoribosylamine--glycine ligase [Defluviitaleaceae bacterium]|nr:phosphoribosylamine--glycine ligase [Defluviitaleaceae bacterium]